MSRTAKAGKRRRAVLGREPEKVYDAISSRHSYGSTEKILRRNRKTWTRLANKRRRALDRAAIHRCLDESGIATP